ncbi:MAG TPA: SUKH-3 domain-containing protein [Symbiobacteriaceae bacterium]|nr:SUKH-3 domain-containing protein [Symbiobacteriaceae bacterium]
MPLTDKTRAFLTAAGWSLERRVDMIDAIAAVQAAGFHVCAPAPEFLRRFSGLCVQVPHRNLRRPIRFEIHPTHAAEMLDAEEILPLEERVGEALHPESERLADWK